MKNTRKYKKNIKTKTKNGNGNRNKNIKQNKLKWNSIYKKNKNHTKKMIGGVGGVGVRYCYMEPLSLAGIGNENVEIIIFSFKEIDDSNAEKLHDLLKTKYNIIKYEKNKKIFSQYSSLFKNPNTGLPPIFFLPTSNINLTIFYIKNKLTDINKSINELKTDLQVLPFQIIPSPSFYDINNKIYIGLIETEKSYNDIIKDNKPDLPLIDKNTSFKPFTITVNDFEVLKCLDDNIDIKNKSQYQNEKSPYDWYQNSCYAHSLMQLLRNIPELIIHLNNINSNTVEQLIDLNYYKDIFNKISFLKKDKTKNENIKQASLFINKFKTYTNDLIIELNTNTKNTVNNIIIKLNDIDIRWGLQHDPINLLNSLSILDFFPETLLKKTDNFYEKNLFLNEKDSNLLVNVKNNDDTDKINVIYENIIILNKFTNSDLIDGIDNIQLLYNNCLYEYLQVNTKTKNNEECVRKSTYKILDYTKYIFIQLAIFADSTYKFNIKFKDLNKLLCIKDTNDKLIKFELISMVCHQGPTLRGGHFINYSRQFKTGEDTANWILHNDMKNDNLYINNINNINQLNDTPYLLLYKRI
jgi:hypothetical protein